MAVMDRPLVGSGAEWSVARAETLCQLGLVPSTWLTRQITTRCAIILAACYALYTKSSHTLPYKDCTPRDGLICQPNALQGCFNVQAK
jgi:hypothetical protein